MRKTKTFITRNSLITPIILIFIFSMILLTSCNGNNRNLLLPMVIKCNLFLPMVIVSGILFLIIIGLFFFGNPKIVLKLIEKEEEIVLNFSQEQPGIPIAMFEILNKRKFLSDRRIKAEFDLQFKCFLTPSLKEILTIESSNPLLTIEKQNGDSRPLEFYIKDGRISDEKTLRQACVDDCYKIVFHPEVIKKNIKGDFTNKRIGFDLELKDFKINFIESRKTKFDERKSLKFEKQPFELNFVFKKEKVSIIVEPVRDDVNNGLQFIKDKEKYTIPYSAYKPQKKLFKFNFSNQAQYRASPPIEGRIFLKVYEGINPRNSNDIFYLGKSKKWDGESTGTEKTVFLRYKEDVNYYCYIKFDEMGQNPLVSRDFRLKLIFIEENDEPTVEWDQYLSVTSSREKTEPVIQIFAEFDSPPDIKFVHESDWINNLVVPKDSNEKFSKNRFEVPVSDLYRIEIEEDKRTELFTLKLGNFCNTGTGYYKWDIGDISLVNNEYIEAQEEAVTAEKASGEIEDNIYTQEEISFNLHPERLKISKFEFNIEVTFNITFQFFPERKSTEEELVRSGNITVNAACRHDVAPNYLVIDFGTSAIATDHWDYSTGLSEYENREPLRLESREYLMKSEDGLLPSIMNIRPNERIGDEKFVSLPAVENIEEIKAEWLITQIKLMLLDGCDEINAPDDFKFIDENGITRTGGQMNLGALIMSAYRNLKSNYISGIVENSRKIIVTYPNAYNSTHIDFLKELLIQVFEDKDKNVYKENIELVSESNAALFRYLKYSAGQKGKKRRPSQEDIIICDIGGGTMDISQAEVKWKKGKDYPTHIEIKKRDGIAFAGEKLDEAIGLQVHQILKECDKNISGSELKRPLAEVNHIQKASELIFKNKESEQPVEQEENETYPGTSTTSGNFYIKKIARKKDKSEKKIKNSTNFRRYMFDFKYTHILNFKKEMSKKEQEEDVKICLGENTIEKGLCFTNQKEHDLDIKIEGESFKPVIREADGSLYLVLKKKDWLELPYIKRFKELFKEKFSLFFKSDEKNIDEKNIPDDTSIVLFGRTSLWPDIQKAIKDFFPKKCKEIFKDKKGLRLKRSVVDGVLQQVVCWPHIDPNDNSHPGLPAIYYQNIPDNWEPKVLIPGKEGDPVAVDLNNSPFFRLGIKSSMGFSPYFGGYCYKRDSLCKKDKKIKIHLKKNTDKSNKIGYDFSLESDKYKNRFKKLKPKIERNIIIPGLKGSYWPIKEVQLDEVKPKDFK